MKHRVVLYFLAVGCLALFVWDMPTPTASGADNPPGPPVVNPTPIGFQPGQIEVNPVPPLLDVTRQFRFIPVFEIMNRPMSPTSKGCRGCHIGGAPSLGPWFGANITQVFNTLETGINPLGQTLSAIPVEDGRNGLLAGRLHGGSMPMFGRRWEAADLDLLDWWLMLYE